MASSNVNDTRLPVRPTFVNLYKWPESDVEFVKSTVNNSNSNNINNNRAGPQVDSLSCRQMYLRSYKFSRKKVGVTEKTVKCLGRIKESVIWASKRFKNVKGNCKIFGRAKDVTYATVSILLHRLLSRSNKVDVAHHDF